MGSSTLLGPEGSALLVFLVLPLSSAVVCLGVVPGWWWGVLVGLLFEICIVDASIFAIAVIAFVVVGGVVKVFLDGMLGIRIKCVVFV